MPGVHSSFLTGSFSRSSFLSSSFSQLSQDEQPWRVYAVRWWVLTVVSVLTLLQGWIWNIYGPIAPAVQPVFKWSDGLLALFANWGTFGWFLAVIPFTWTMDSIGLRPAVIVASGLVFVSSCLRCVTTTLPAVTWLCNVAQLFNGLAGPCGCAAPPLLSAIWFAPEQRVTATSISACCNYLGVALSFIVGPLLVPKHDDPAEIRRGYMLYMYIMTGASGLLLLMAVLSFPASPACPPSASAAVQRTDFRAGIKSIVRQPSFWYCGLSYGVMTGFYGGWGAMMADNLKEFGISEQTSGLLGCLATLAGCIAGMGLSFAVDAFEVGAKGMKLIILALNAGSALLFVVFALACATDNFLPAVLDSKAVLYGTCVLVGLTINGTIPLYYELCCESCYPIAEGLTTGALITINNLGCAIFLVIPYFVTGTGWMNWAMAVAAGLAVPLFIPFPLDRKRAAVDSGIAQMINE